MENELHAKEKILAAAKQEFLRHGYKDASLRNIATSAGMTTGAIYTYFKNKDALFEAIVGPACLLAKTLYATLSSSYYTNEAIVSALATEKTLADLHTIYNLIYAHFDEFRLLVVGSDGSSRSGFVQMLVELETEHTLAYWKRMIINHPLSPPINNTLVHIISESYIEALLEPVRHTMSHEEALGNLEFLATFFTGGWQSVFQGSPHD